MAHKHRKLFPTNSTDCQIYSCDPYPYPDPDPDFFFPLPPPPPPPPFHSAATATLSPYLIISLSLFAAVSVLLTAYVVLAKRCFRRGRIESGGHEDFLDHNHGPDIDHPIWYINTVGLQSSVINSIAVIKYKKGNTPTKESTCSVCLSEFIEDETLRLLPKCKHAFHMECIDTWLRTHTNCPLCRAFILPNTSSDENTNLGNNNDRENMGETGVAIGISDSKEISDNSVASLMRENGRRSVSMDSSMALMAVSVNDFLNYQLQGNFVKHVVGTNKYNFGTNPTQVNENLRIGSSSSAESLHSSPVSMKRSFSCSGRLFSSSRCASKSSSSILPL